MFRLTRTERQEDLHSYLEEEQAREMAPTQETLDEKALAKYHNLLTKCLEFKAKHSASIYDQIFEQLSAVTGDYNSLNTKTREMADELLAHQAKQQNFPSTRLLLIVHETISRHRERFCTGIICAVRTELVKRIKENFINKYNFLTIYKHFSYSNLVLDAFSEDYAEMRDDERSWHTQNMLRNIYKHKAEDLVGILNFAHTMTISLKNAEGMPGKVGKHCYTYRNPITLLNEKIEYDVKFVENFPMVVAEAIQQRLHSPQRGVSLTINL